MPVTVMFRGHGCPGSSARSVVVPKPVMVKVPVLPVGTSERRTTAVPWSGGMASSDNRSRAATSCTACSRQSCWFSRWTVEYGSDAVNSCSCPSTVKSTVAVATAVADAVPGFGSPPQRGAAASLAGRAAVPPARSVLFPEGPGTQLMLSS